VLRRLGTASLLVPILTGASGILATRLGWIDPELRVALIVVLTTGLLWWIVADTAARLDAAESGREQAIGAARVSEETLRTVIQNLPVYVLTTDARGTPKNNPAS
jgi:hypothetical protein